MKATAAEAVQEVSSGTPAAARWTAESFGWFKTKDLTLDLRVAEVQVNRWVRRGGFERKKGRITEESLRWLCRYHPEEIPFETLSLEARNRLKLSLDYGAALSYVQRLLRHEHISVVEISPGPKSGSGKLADSLGG